MSKKEITIVPYYSFYGASHIVNSTELCDSVLTEINNLYQRAATFDSGYKLVMAHRWGTCRRKKYEIKSVLCERGL